MKLIVGLGNPGKKYEKTRHNIGFVILDALHKELEIKCSVNSWELSTKFNSEISGCTYENEKLILAKPTTFMNDSGQAVTMIAKYYKIPPKDIIVIHDDKDIELGKIKKQTERGHAGHNGVRSIIEHIGEKDFTRLRVGVASKNKKRMDDIAKFVLDKFSLLEKKVVKQSVDDSLKIIFELIRG